MATNSISEKVRAFIVFSFNFLKSQTGKTKYPEKWRRTGSESWPWKSDCDCWERTVGRKWERHGCDSEQKLVDITRNGLVGFGLRKLRCVAEIAWLTATDSIASSPSLHLYRPWRTIDQDCASSFVPYRKEKSLINKNIGEIDMSAFVVQRLG